MKILVNEKDYQTNSQSRTTYITDQCQYLSSCAPTPP